MPILALNAGSSSLKFGLFDDGGERELGSDSIGGNDVAGAVARVLERVSRETVRAVGHRVVHGGTSFRRSVRIDARVRDELERLTELAPLHNPPALAGIRAASEALPRAAQVAVFDTAYYADLPPRAVVYPLPYAWFEEWGIRRFGFHGISHADCARRASEMLGSRHPEARIVSCHLGNGCSATASRAGVAVATTMGYTPLEGLMMGTRSGSVDPGALLAVARGRGLDAERLETILNRESGLLGVSGVSADYREVESAAASGNSRAGLALDLYADRVRSAIGTLAVTLGGVDALVFTAGVGENSASLREAVCAGLECLGVSLDAAANASCRPDADVARPASAGRILVLRAREERVIAREAALVLDETGAGADR